MASHLAARAIEDAVKHGKAIVKFISANDVGVPPTAGTKFGSHNCITSLAEHWYGSHYDT
jgi:hypothetical protein